MAEQTAPDLKELFRQAAEIAQQVPERMQEAAFNRALDVLLGEGRASGGAAVRPKRDADAPGVQRLGGQASVKELLKLADSTRYPDVVRAGKVLDRSLLVLQLALHDHAIDGLTPTDIARVLTEKFRLATSRQAVGMALKDAANLVDRAAEGNGYRYRIMDPGEEYLAQLRNASGDKAERPSRRTGEPRSSRCRVATEAPDERAKSPGVSDVRVPKAPAKVRTGRSTPPGKLGPKAAVTELIELGYFSSAKTGPQVQEYLKKKRGFDIGIAQLRLAMLRLVRDGVLERDENDAGQYEYKRP